MKNIARQFIDRATSLPQNKAGKFFTIIGGIVGLTLLIGQASATLDVQTLLSNNVMYIEKILTTTNGLPGWTWKVNISKDGIKINTSGTGALKRDANDYIVLSGVWSNDIATSTISGSQIYNQSLQNYNFAANSITSRQISTGVITCDKIGIPGFNCSGSAWQVCPVNKVIQSISSTWALNCTGIIVGSPSPIAGCADGQVYTWDGSAWACTAPSQSADDGSLWAISPSNSGDIYNKNHQVGICENIPTTNTQYAYGHMGSAMNASEIAGLPLCQCSNNNCLQSVVSTAPPTTWFPWNGVVPGAPGGWGAYSFWWNDVWYLCYDTQSPINGPGTYELYVKTQNCTDPTSTPVGPYFYGSVGRWPSMAINWVSVSPIMNNTNENLPGFRWSPVAAGKAFYTTGTYLGSAFLRTAWGSNIGWFLHLPASRLMAAGSSCSYYISGSTAPNGGWVSCTPPSGKVWVHTQTPITQLHDVGTFLVSSGGVINTGGREWNFTTWYVQYTWKIAFMYIPLILWSTVPPLNWLSSLQQCDVSNPYLPAPAPAWVLGTGLQWFHFGLPFNPGITYQNMYVAGSFIWEADPFFQNYNGTRCSNPNGPGSSRTKAPGVYKLAVKCSVNSGATMPRRNYMRAGESTTHDPSCIQMWAADRFTGISTYNLGYGWVTVRWFSTGTYLWDSVCYSRTWGWGYSPRSRYFAYDLNPSIGNGTIMGAPSTVLHSCQFYVSGAIQWWVSGDNINLQLSWSTYIATYSWLIASGGTFNYEYYTWQMCQSTPSLADFSWNHVIYVTGGKVGILTDNPQYNLDVNGIIRGAALQITSDARKKENIKEIPDALRRVLGIHGYTYTLKKDGTKHYGVIAQEVEEMFPYIVDTDAAWYKAVRYNALIGAVIEAMHTLDERISNNRTMLDENETMLELLEKKAKE
jgi:Chaperone of endosialidase